MKKIILSLIVSMFSLVMYSQTYDVTISGVVTSEITGEAIPLQEMIITSDTNINSGFMYYNTVITDDYGYYVDVMQVPTGVEGNVEVMTLACNNMMLQSGRFADDPASSQLIFDFQICGDSIGNECQAMYDYYQGNTPLSIQFTDESWGSPIFWAWDFGDGETSSQQNPLHTYPDYGEYFTSLTITNQDSTCNSTIEMLIRVINDTIGPWGCQAMYFTYPDSLDFRTVNFIDMSYVESPSGIPDTWYWDFGDGNSSTEQSPIHTYSVEGEYDVCLSITSEFGNTCESTECQLIYVDGLNNNCFTWFDYEMNDLTLDFQAYLEGGYDADYTWDFGNGIVGTGSAISHTYAESGIYDVVLTAVNNDSTGSCTSTYYDRVWVGEEISFNISGFIYLEDSMMADLADVHLMTFDTLGNGLLNVATTQIDSDGYYEFEEIAFENCMYFILSELTDQSAYFGDYVPTYHLVE